LPARAVSRDDGPHFANRLRELFQAGRKSYCSILTLTISGHTWGLIEDIVREAFSFKGFESIKDILKGKQKVEGVRTSQMWTGSSAKTCFLYFPTH
jgi:hypothetical protein